MDYEKMWSDLKIILEAEKEDKVDTNLESSLILSSTLLKMKSMENVQNRKIKERLSKDSDIDDLKVLISDLEKIKSMVSEYKELASKGLLNDYQKGFLDGYEHMRMVGNIVLKVTE